MSKMIYICHHCRDVIEEKDDIYVYNGHYFCKHCYEQEIRSEQSRLREAEKEID